MTENTLELSRNYRSKTVCRPVGCGNIYVTIAYKPDGKFHFLKIINEKEGQCGNSWGDSLSDILTFVFRRANKEEIKAVLKSLRGHFCNNVRPNKFSTKSCIDAIHSVLKEEFLNDTVHAEKL